MGRGVGGGSSSSSGSKQFVVGTQQFSACGAFSLFYFIKKNYLLRTTNYFRNCLLPTATAYCRCLLPLPTATATAYCLLLLLTTTGCFQPEGGCLDIEATNFNIAADEPCDADNSVSGCPCTYPNFSLNTDYLFDKIDYEADAIYVVEGQFIRIDNIQFYLSNFQFRRTSGEWTAVEDTISLGVLNVEGALETQILTDDFVLVERQSRIEIGAIKESGSFDSLRFTVGVDGLANTVIPDSISNTRHPLAESDMHLGNRNDGYIFNQIILYRDTLSDTDPTILNISKNIENGQLVTVKKSISVKSTIGTNFSLGTLTVNHAKWFDGIKFVTDTDAVMIEKIVANTPNVFSITN